MKQKINTWDRIKVTFIYLLMRVLNIIYEIIMLVYQIIIFIPMIITKSLYVKQIQIFSRELTKPKHNEKFDK